MELAAIITIVILILAVPVVFYIPRFMLNRATRAVIRIFRQHDALACEDAKTIEELGLALKNFTGGAFKIRDFRPYALMILRDAGIIRTTEDGRLYLAEEKLATSRWGTKSK